MSAEFSPTENKQVAVVDERKRSNQLPIEEPPSASRRGETVVPSGLRDGRLRDAIISVFGLSRKVVTSMPVQFFAGVATGIFFLLLMYQLLAFAIGILKLMLS